MVREREGQNKRRFPEDSESKDAEPPKKRRRTSNDSTVKAYQTRSKTRLSKSPPLPNEQAKAEAKAQDGSPATEPVEAAEPPVKITLEETATEPVQAKQVNPSPKEEKKKKGRSQRQRPKRLRFKRGKPVTTKKEERKFDKTGLEVFSDLHQRVDQRTPPEGVKPQYRYEIGEHVLVWYGKHMQYEAVVLGRMADWNPARENFDYEFKIHYNGWAKTWDAWVEDITIEDLDKESKRAAIERNRSRKNAVKSRKGKKKFYSDDDEEDASYDARTDPNATSLAKRRAEATWIDETVRQLRLKNLEDQIQESCRLVSEMSRVAPLPTEKGKRVVDICESFLKSKSVTERNDRDRRQYYQLIHNMLILFDRMAFTRCLCEGEEGYVLQKHFETNLAPKRLLGVEHLLRFFCEFGGIMCRAGLIPHRHKQIMKKANVFAGYVARKVDSLLPNKYAFENIDEVWNGRQYMLLNPDGSEKIA